MSVSRHWRHFTTFSRSRLKLTVPTRLLTAFLPDSTRGSFLMASTEQVENTQQNSAIESGPAPEVMNEINTARVEQQSLGSPAGGTDSSNNNAIGPDGKLDFAQDDIYQSQFNNMSQSSSSETSAPEFENDPVLDYAEKNFEKLDGDG